MSIIAAVLLVLVATFCCLLGLVGLPGNWLMVLSSGLYVLLAGYPGDARFGWPVVIVLAVLALLGEFLEFIAGAVGTSRAGGSRRSAVFAIIGSMIGGMLGLGLGMPIPLLGPLIAALVLASCGALVGAVIGELQTGRALGRSWRVGQAAFWSRLLGTLGKAIVGAAMLVLIVVAVLV